MAISEEFLDLVAEEISKFYTSLGYEYEDFTINVTEDGSHINIDSYGLKLAKDIKWN